MSVADHTACRRAFGLVGVVAVLMASPAAGQVVITAEGEVPESCALSLPTASQLNLGDLASTAPRVIDVNVSCNTPWTYSLVSTKLGLTAQTAAPSGGGFTTVVPYNVTTQFQTDAGAFGDVVASTGLTAANAAGCVANNAAGCAFADSGAAVSINRTGTLTLQWSTPSDPLLASAYSDTLTLTVLVI